MCDLSLDSDMGVSGAGHNVVDLSLELVGCQVAFGQSVRSGKLVRNCGQEFWSGIAVMIVGTIARLGQVNLGVRLTFSDCGNWSARLGQINLGKRKGRPFK